MWKQILEFAARVVSLGRATESNTAAIADLQERCEKLAEELRALREEQRDLAEAVRHLATRIDRVQDNETHEREKLVLQLENAFLRFERRLPPASAAEGQDESG